MSVKSGVHTTVGRFHTGSAGVAEVAEVAARSRGRVGPREKFGSGVEKAGIHTEIADFTGVTWRVLAARAGLGFRSRGATYGTLLAV